MLTAVSESGTMEPMTDESLLSTPAPGDLNSFTPISRQTTTYITYDEVFQVKERTYTQQYAGLYFSRLNMLRPRVLKAAKARWSSGASPTPHEPRVLDVKTGKVCFVVGTVYVDMPLKPNILDEVTAEHWVVAPPPRSKYASEDDEIVLEDESGRLKLTGAVLHEHILVTGVIAAFLGCETATGEFEVIDICYAAWEPQASVSESQSQDDDKYVAFISGLNIGDNSAFDLRLQLLVDFLTGELGAMEDQSTNSKIARIIVAGNSVTRLKPVDDEKKPNARNKYGAEILSYNTEPLQSLDTLLTSLCSGIDVDLMPGDGDPANCSLPQQPIHFAILPSASRHSTMHHCTNPHSFDVHGVR
ncbi:hypothetical protein HDV00_003238 [Rhizophlyctis rosea]|nr:hypothetical protein HDV00_003238 [Rhizophlyctis rosea]